MSVVRIRDLSSEISITGDIYIPIDKEAYSTISKKMTLSDVAAYVNLVNNPISGFTFDTLTGELTLETSYGSYVTDLDGRYAVSLSGLTDVEIVSEQQNDVLVYSGGSWINATSYPISTLNLISPYATFEQE